MTDYNQLLSEVGEEIFESLAFMLVMPGMDDDEPAPAGPRVAATVDFSGPFGGAVAVAVGEEMLGELATNMLGMDETEPPNADQQQDALKELLNVVCGNLLPKLGGADAVFDVHPPELTEAGQLPDAWQGQGPAGRCELPLDTGSAELVLFVDAQAPAA